MGSPGIVVPTCRGAALLAAIVLLPGCSSLTKVQKKCGVDFSGLGREQCLAEIYFGSPKTQRETGIHETYAARHADVVKDEIDMAKSARDACQAAQGARGRYRKKAVAERVVGDYDAALGRLAEKAKNDAGLCSLEAICRGREPDRCEKDVLGPCAAQLANRKLLAIQGDKACADGSAHIGEEQLACLTAFIEYPVLSSLRSSADSHRRCTCRKAGKLLAGYLESRQGNLASILRRTAPCTAKDVPVGSAQDKEFLLEQMSGLLYGSSREDGSSEFDVKWLLHHLDLFAIPYSEKQAGDLVKKLTARKVSDALNRDALAVALDKDRVPAVPESLRKPVCMFALYPMSPERELSAAESAAIGDYCRETYEAWGEKVVKFFLKNQRYDRFNAMVKGHLSRSPLAKAVWLSVAQQKVDDDVTKTRGLFVTYGNLCRQGEKEGLRRLDGLPDYGVLGEEKRAALARGWVDFDAAFMKRVSAGMAASCPQAETRLLAVVTETRGEGPAKALGKLLRSQRLTAETLAEKEKGVFGVSATPALIEVSRDVFLCLGAERDLDLAQARLDEKRALEAFQLIGAADRKFKLDRARKMAAAGLKVLKADLVGKAREASARGLAGMSLIYLLTLAEIYPDSEGGGELCEKASAALMEEVQLRKRLVLTQLRAAAQMGKTLSAGLAEKLAPAPDGEGKKGTGVLLVPTMLAAGWTATNTSETRDHTYYVQTQVRNNAKFTACQNLPGVVSRLNAANVAYDLAQRGCREAERSVSNQIGGFGGLLAGLATGAVCNVTAQQVLVSDLQQEKAKLEAQCNESDYITTSQARSHRFSAQVHRWNHRVTLQLRLESEAGKSMCALEKNGAEEVKDVVYSANSSVSLQEDPFQEPDHERIVRGLFDGAVSDMVSAVDGCMSENIKGFLSARVSKSRASKEELEAEVSVRAAAVSKQRAPEYADVKETAEALLPVATIKEIAAAGKAGEN